MSEHAPAGPESFSAALNGAKSGSPGDFARLIEPCRDYLLLVANKELDSDVRAKVAPSDLVQETLVRAQKHLARFEGKTQSELLGWLRQILMNYLLDVTRQFKQAGKRRVDLEVEWPRNGPGQVSCPAPGPSDVARALEEARHVHAALARLPDEQRQAIELRSFDLLPFDQIGERLNRSADAARKLWSRAIERLAVELEHLDDSR
jgi:RNA polymerase sigma-70 factor (ECF subfamily)